MAIRPHLTRLTLEEAAWMMQGLYLADLSQLERGIPGILHWLRRGTAAGGGRRLRYVRDDPDEVWQTLRDLWASGGGDCEDLAAAVAAELTYKGVPARPVIYRVRRGLAHAVVQVLGTGQILDPSRLGGMGEVDPTRVGDILYQPLHEDHVDHAGPVPVVANPQGMGWDGPTARDAAIAGLFGVWQ